MASCWVTMSGSNRSAPSLVRVGSLAGAGITLVVVVLYTAWSLRVPATCRYDAIEGLASFVLVTVSVVGFVSGRILGLWFEGSVPKYHANTIDIVVVDSPSDPSTPASSVATVSPADVELARQAAIVVQLGLIAFMALAAALLLYETVALSDPAKNWPITYYVRCMTREEPFGIGIAAFAICFLVGHWIWYPSRGGTE